MGLSTSAEDLGIGISVVGPASMELGLGARASILGAKEPRMSVRVLMPKHRVSGSNTNILSYLENDFRFFKEK